MSGEVTTTPMPEAFKGMWCGRLDLHLLNRQDRTIGMLEFSLRLDICTVWFQNRTLAVMHRDAFRAWLFNPIDVLIVDDLVWSLEGHRVALSIDRQPPHLVSDVFITHLMTVI